MKRPSASRAVVAALLASSLAGSDALADERCHATQFETTLVREACARGGQKAAKDAIKEWMVQVRRRAEAAQAEAATRSEPAAKGDAKAPAATATGKVNSVAPRSAEAKLKLRDARPSSAPAVDPQNLRCTDCHTTLAPKYKLKPEGLELYRELGGR